MNHKFRIVHTATGLTLRQFAKRYPVPVYCGKELAEFNFQYEPLTYVRFETGSLGFVTPTSWGFTGGPWCLGPGFHAEDRVIYLPAAPPETGA